nr:MAG TPA: hypothetical protein [Caudoviricetes sp.]
MPDIANGREKVNTFLKEKGIKKAPNRSQALRKTTN